MTFDQGLVFAVVIAMMGLFAWGRWRYDLVAVLALLVSVAVGIVPPNQAFKGFSDDIVIIVASALVVSAAVARSGIIERVGPLARTLSYDHRPADRCPRRLGHTALGLRQEHRRARNADADRLSARAAHRHLALLSVDADVVRRSARRHRHLGRHLAEHHRLARARAVARPALQYVRLHAGRRRDRDCRLRSFSCSAGVFCRRIARERPPWMRPSISKVTPRKSPCPRTSPAAGLTVKALEDLGENEIEVIAAAAGT